MERFSFSGDMRRSGAHVKSDFFLNASQVSNNSQILVDNYIEAINLLNILPFDSRRLFDIRDKKIESPAY
jgi:hypothetical protein